jgi:hypothetical protein
VDPNTFTAVSREAPGFRRNPSSSPNAHTSQEVNF